MEIGKFAFGAKRLAIRKMYLLISRRLRRFLIVTLAIRNPACP